MSDASSTLQEPTFRSRYERARKLNVAEQIQECAEYLENPEVLAAEFMDAYRQVATLEGSDCLPTWAGSDGEDELTLEFFAAGLDVTIEGEEISLFRVVANDVDPLPRVRPGDPGARYGLDYLGLTGDGSLAFGAAPSEAESTPYLLFLRLLNALAELAPPAQLEHIDRELLNGELPPDPEIDLHLVLWSLHDDAEWVQLAQLTRDLVDVVRRELAGAPDFPCLLRRVLCLRMDAEAFDGSLVIDWVI